MSATVGVVFGPNSGGYFLSEPGEWIRFTPEGGCIATFGCEGVIDLIPQTVPLSEGEKVIAEVSGNPYTIWKKAVPYKVFSAHRWYRHEDLRSIEALTAQVRQDPRLRPILGWFRIPRHFTLESREFRAEDTPYLSDAVFFTNDRVVEKPGPMSVGRKGVRFPPHITQIAKMVDPQRLLVLRSA